MRVTSIQYIVSLANTRQSYWAGLDSLTINHELYHRIPLALSVRVSVVCYKTTLHVFRIEHDW